MAKIISRPRPFSPVPMVVPAPFVKSEKVEDSLIDTLRDYADVPTAYGKGFFARMVGLPESARIALYPGNVPARLLFLEGWKAADSF